MAIWFEAQSLTSHKKPSVQYKGYRGQALKCHIVDDVEHAAPPDAGDLVVHEIQRTTCVRPRLDQDRCPCADCPSL
ncbi:hypothetical protein MesoLjLa_60540 [Mesorhizobium sp. L-2-11]|nr:hypothetical protein MesoLjLa_60540 [Mesorhizobium sp. L-2-11]